jgi:dTDP-4-amino-4,6-dideoxygalactose transaminase
MRVPFVDLAAQEGPLASEVLAAIAEVGKGARFILGPRVEAFEQWLAAHCGVAHALGVASGSDALELALRALGIGAGDAVVTPALSFVAAAEAIAATGARPFFCDVDAETMNASERTVREAMARAAQAGMRVRAILPVDLFGRCAPTGELGALASSEGLALVMDAAQAIGGQDEAGRASGAVGDAGCFSFFPTKNLGAWGDGGAIVTNRDDVAGRVRRLRSHGALEPYVHGELGRNSRLDALQAAVLLAKAPRLGAWQGTRARIAHRYQTALTGLPLTLPATPALPAVHAWHAFVVRAARRDALVAALREGGVEARVYYPVPLHRQPCFASLREPSLPVAEAICRTAVALPIFPALRDEQQGHVIEQIAAFYRNAGERIQQKDREDQEG